MNYKKYYLWKGIYNVSGNFDNGNQTGTFYSDKPKYSNIADIYSVGSCKGKPEEAENPLKSRQKYTLIDYEFF